MSALALDHFYTHGDVYEALDACDQLEQVLGRLKRQHVLDDQTWTESKHDVAEVRARLEEHLGQG